MKKLILVVGSLVLLSSLGLKAYFAFVPAPEATLEKRLADIFPDRLPGWRVIDKDMAESEESSERISRFLNFDDALYRIYQNGDVSVGLYIAYWSPGKTSYRWAGSHTPDTCWVLNGWSRTDRKYRIPFYCGNTPMEPAEFGVYEKGGHVQNVYFWHLIGGEAAGYNQKGNMYFLNALVDIREHGLNQRQEQFFIRLSSNKDLETLKDISGFNDILISLQEIGLQQKLGVTTG